MSHLSDFMRTIAERIDEIEEEIVSVQIEHGPSLTEATVHASDKKRVTRNGVTFSEDLALTYEWTINAGWVLTAGSYVGVSRGVEVSPA